MRHFLTFLFILIASMSRLNAQSVGFSLYPGECGTGITQPTINGSATPAFEKVGTSGIISCAGENVTFDFGPNVASVTATYIGGFSTEGATGNPITFAAQPLPVINGSNGYIHITNITYTDGTVCNYSVGSMKLIFHSPPSIQTLAINPYGVNMYSIDMTPMYAGNQNYDITITSPSGIITVIENHPVNQYIFSTASESGLWTVTACDGYGCGESCLSQTINTGCTTPTCSAYGSSSTGVPGTVYSFSAAGVPITPSNATVTWTANGGASPSSGTVTAANGYIANISWATTGTKTVTFTVTNNSSPVGCTPASTTICPVDIIISTLCTTPTCNASGPSTGSTGTSYTFSAGTVTPAGATVTWTSSGGGSPASGTGTTANVSWATTGSKSVTFTVTNSSSPSGCSPSSSSTCSANIDINGGCDAISACTAVSYSGPTGTAGTSYSFGAFFVNPPAGTTYTWTATGDATPSSGTGLSANISWATNGIKVITFTATNSSTPAGCSPSSTASCQVQFEVTGGSCIYGDCDITGIDKIAVADPRQAYTYTVNITPNASLPSSEYEWELYEVGSIPFTPIQSGIGTIADVYFPYDGNFVIQFKVDHSSDGISCDPSEPYICEKYISVGSACDIPACNFISTPDPLTAANGSTNTNYTFTIAGNVVSWEATGGGVPATGTGNTATVQWSSTGSKKVRFTLDNGDIPAGCRPNSINVCDFKMILRTGSTLPVELISFIGESKNCESKLTWKTGSEVNFDHFEIQKSEDNVNFTKLSEINAKGSNSTYSFFENTRKKQVHYRLLMVDYDGNTKESNIITLNSTCEREGIYISPNPTKNLVNVSFENTSAIGKTIKITSVEGRIIKEIVIKQLNEIIDLSGNNSGIYMINIPGYNNFKIVKN